jgi:DNA-directed RNA polymerase beta' subunit
MNTIKEIDNITFGIYSPDEIREMSVCHVEHTKKTGHGSVYDPRMGTSLTSVICETCNEDACWCPGHFGHIELHEPIIHPLYYRNVLNLLSCVCFRCCKLMITEEQLQLEGLTNMKGPARFNKIIEKVKKIGICCNDECRAEKQKLKLSTVDHTISMSHEVNKKTNSIIMTTDEIHKILDNVSDEDVRLMGFDPLLSHPRNYILSVLPVLPPVDRPYVQVNGNIWDDDITVQYFEIIKANEQIRQANINELDINDVKRVKAIASLIFRISTTFNNNQNKAKHTTNARPIKGIKERLAGKEGQIRSNMMGKRCNHTARTVIGPDPTLKTGQIAVPREMTNVLTVPERVMDSNREQLQKYVNDGLVQTIVKDDDKKTCINITRFRIGTRIIAGDVIYRDGCKIVVDDLKQRVRIGDVVERDGKKLANLKVADRDYPLEIGMIVNRKLQDGDIVLLNRQPTLHKGSMLGMEVVVREHRTIRMNLAICKSFNADFDGDEMNLHVPQGLESQAELKYLSAAKHNIISAQSSKPGMAIVQDSLLGAYRMTKDGKPITKGQFFSISMVLDLKEDVMVRIQHIRRVLKEKGKKVQCYTGKGIISLFLPSDFNYEFKNNASIDEPTVKIHKGVMYEGVLDKTMLGSAHSSLMHLLNKEYGPDEAMYFIDCIQFCTTQWLLIRGFTVGLGDCLVTDESKDQEIRDVVKKCYIEADGIATTTSHPGVREIRVNGSLNKAKDVGLKIAKDSLDVNNNFLSTVISGSKGDFFNITQITGLLGQQNLKGQRVPLVMNHGRRSLPHYPFADLSLESQYESRGFISNSFIHGLNPREFYFHAMSGREGITDTAMGTATSGYMQRRIVKLTEDIKVAYDGTVRDATGKIYQMAYGDNGIDPTMTTKVSGVQEACDIGRLIAKMNMNHENNLKQ